MQSRISFRRACLLVWMFTSASCFCQSSAERDSVHELSEIVVRAYQYNRPLFETPATVGVIATNDFQRFNGSSLVPSFNTVPAVRLEERSPGSYRVSIRGSTIRSPFGVRNVKVYWNQMPLTDPGGNTYLNQLDPDMIGNVEIVKGPGSSLYGAGTGGVLLLSSPDLRQGQFIKGVLQLATFGSQIMRLGYEEAKEKSSHQVQVLHQKSDGYRNQTRLFRDVVNSVFHFEVDDDQVLETFIFYSDLFYETPGGLTLAEYQANPRQARPPTAVSPGAEEQKASVHLQSFYLGVFHEYLFNRDFYNKTSVYGNLVKFENAAIRNYDHRNEQSLGVRSVTTLNRKIGAADLTLLGGGEFQFGFLPTKSYQNLSGNEGALIADDESKAIQYSVFGQAELRVKKISATAGLSLNGQQLDFQRLSDPGAQAEHITYDLKLMPRLAVLWSTEKVFAVYGSVSKGFSPPTLAEIVPSNGVFNSDLKPETGTNYEVGIRSGILKNVLKVNLTGYAFRLNETIVIRRDEDGAEYFVNAGNTRQNGIEAFIGFSPNLTGNSFIKSLEAWTSYTYNHYRFGDYVKDQDDFSGNELTGVPAHVFNGGLDLSTKPGIYFRATCIYTAKLPLNDANTVYADPYFLPGLRAGYKNKRFECYAGGENLLDKTYSLGNDLNAAGGRYYNAAPTRSFYGGLKINFGF